MGKKNSASSDMSYEEQFMPILKEISEHAIAKRLRGIAVHYIVEENGEISQANVGTTRDINPMLLVGGAASLSALVTNDSLQNRIKL